MVFKLYGSPMSTCTARVKAVLEELNLKYELIPINFGTGEHKQPPHIHRNVSLFFFFFIVLNTRMMDFHWRSIIKRSPVVVSPSQPFGQVPALEDGDLTLFGEF